MVHSKLIGKTIEEFIHDVIFEYTTEINYRDRELLEYMLADFEERICSDAIEELEDDLQSAESRIDYLEGLLQEYEIEYE